MAKAAQIRPRRKDGTRSAMEAGDTSYRKGLQHLDAHDYREAITCFERALSENRSPAQQSAILFGLANAARRIGHPRAAEAFYNQVLMIEPARVEAIVNLANLHRSTSRLRDAQSLLADALKSDPEVPELWLTLGNVMRESGDTASAEAFFHEALRLKPGYASALASLGDFLVDRGDAAGALEAYDAALRTDPANAQIRLHRALLLLSEGKLAEGWRDYAYRFKAAKPPLKVTHKLKAWSGDPILRGRLLISAEQGLGDQLIFASCFGDAIKRAQAAKVLIECESRLVPIIARSFPDADVHPYKAVDQAGVRTMNYDWLAGAGGATHAVPMGSLPALLRPDLSAFLSGPSYLRADPDKAAAWSRWISDLPEGRVIGLCWRSGKMGGLRAQQFASLSAWARFLGDTSGIFVSLQYDGTPEEISALTEAAGRPVHVPPGLDQKNDLDGTAALISRLDAVVTAPTAVSALSAAMGTPTFKILFDRSWTSLGQSYEPLSPACRLMRPATAGDWENVFARTRDALACDPWLQLDAAVPEGVS